MPVAIFKLYVSQQIIQVAVDSCQSLRMPLGYANQILLHLHFTYFPAGPLLICYTRGAASHSGPKSAIRTLASRPLVRRGE